MDYIKGVNDFTSTKKVKAFEKLTTEEKREFLNYPITVKDLKDLDIDTIKEIFQRINSTDYSLNANEKINAKYGDGEFAMFCKQIVDPEFNPTEEITDVLIEKREKDFLNAFFNENSVFSENDKNRMFDTQFVMLFASTILDGDYFGRSTSINTYLEKYNSQFSNYQLILDKLKYSIEVVSQINFPASTFWFNKANLFTLLYELTKLDKANINIENLELKLLDLETKSDIYFTADDTTGISEDERKYFEYSRQGVNELQARRHRGKVIEYIILSSRNENIEISEIEKKNVARLEKENMHYVIIALTNTGYSKKIIDATKSFREFLKNHSIHDYNSQNFGPDYKISKTVFFIGNNKLKKETTMSLYRTVRGDYRMWISDINSFSEPDNKLAVVLINSEILVLNISKIEYE